MTGRKRPSLLSGIAAALALSVSGAALLAVLGPALGPGAALRAVIAVLGLAYLLYLLGQGGRPFGRVTALLLWSVASALAGWAAPPLVAYILLHVGMLWLVRCVYFHSSPLSALADLGVGALGAAFAGWAALRSGSALSAFWCFFLAQAFFVSIPAGFGRHGSRASTAADEDELGFERAHRAAEGALRRLTAR